MNQKQFEPIFSKTLQSLPIKTTNKTYKKILLEEGISSFNFHTSGVKKVI